MTRQEEVHKAIEATDDKVKINIVDDYKIFSDNLHPDIDIVNKFIDDVNSYNEKRD